MKGTNMLPIIAIFAAFTVAAPADALPQTVANIGISVEVQNTTDIQQKPDGTIDCSTSNVDKCPEPVLTQTPDGPAMIINW